MINILLKSEMIYLIAWGFISKAKKAVGGTSFICFFLHVCLEASNFALEEADPLRQFFYRKRTNVTSHDVRGGRPWSVVVGKRHGNYLSCAGSLPSVGARGLSNTLSGVVKAGASEGEPA